MWSPDVFTETLFYAARAHGEQKYPAEPFSYVVHLVNVAQEAMVAVVGAADLDADFVLRCALLHDTIEDTPTSYQDLVSAFGQPVADGVRALSKDPALPKEEQLSDSLSRIVMQPREVWVVKLADRISNLQRPPAYWDRAKRQRYRREARMIHATLSAGHVGLARRLLEKIDAYQSFIDEAPATDA